MKKVVNPIGDITEYWYDVFGNIRYKQQPDLGTISYAYDLLGNVRFVQTEQRMDDFVMTFNEYDDLNRLVVVGEARFDDPHEMRNGSVDVIDGAVSHYLITLQTPWFATPADA